MICNWKMKPGNKLRLSKLGNKNCNNNTSNQFSLNQLPVWRNWVLWSTKYSPTVLCMMHGRKEVCVIPNCNWKNHFYLTLKTQNTIWTSGKRKHSRLIIFNIKSLPLEQALSALNLHCHVRLLQQLHRKTRTCHYLCFIHLEMNFFLTITGNQLIDVV